MFVVFKIVMLDVCIVDFGLFDMEGMVLINEIRCQFLVLIIVLLVCVYLLDRVLGLELGVDDYVVKLFDLCEVIVCICFIFRCFGQLVLLFFEVSVLQEVKFVGWIYWFLFYGLVLLEGEEMFLFIGEVVFLEVLLCVFKWVLIRDYLLEYGGWDESFDRLIDVWVFRICKKFMWDGELFVICMIYGLGYMLICDVSWI